MALFAQLGGVLLLLAFLAFIFLAGKGWRWHHVTTLVLIFFGSLFFVVLAASVLKNKSVWQVKYQQMAQELEQEQQKAAELRTGPLSAASSEADSLLRLQNELVRTIMDRGRVWRDVQLTGVQGNQFAFRFPDRNIPGLDAPPPLHRLQPNTIIYGFKEKDGPDGWRVPAFYMGKFVVQSATPDSIVATPAQPMDRIQMGEARPDGAPWAFYEIMPADNPEKFAALSNDQIKELLSPGGWHGRPAAPGATPQTYQKVVDEYLRDGKDAAESDPPERVWTVVELTQAWKEDVDATDAAPPIPTRLFDVNGRALPADLRQGAASDFQPGDQLMMDSATAEKLIQQGVAKRIKNVYRRPLRDYAYNFDELNRNLRVLDDRARLVTHLNATLQQAIDKAKRQIALREDEKTKLAEDLQHINRERDALKQYRAALETQYAEMRRNLVALYNENLELVERLRQIERAIIDAVQQQLANAATR